MNGQNLERIIGNKSFELSNHLGNVLEVTTDRKVQQNTEAEIVAFNDYYPYGMLMEGRYGQKYKSNYRYAFQGQEKDDGIKGLGNSYNYTYRMHDSRLGRFFAVDPIQKEFPYYSPYQFSGNRTIDALEFEGQEALPATDAARTAAGFRPKLQINLPGGQSVTVYSFNGQLVISKADRFLINSTPGFSAETQNYGDRSYYNTNSQNFDIVAAEGGAHDYESNKWFRSFRLKGPASVTQQVPVVTPGNQNVNVTVRNFNRTTGAPVPLGPATANARLNSMGVTAANNINANLNNVLNAAPPNTVRNITGVNIQINSNLTAAQQATVRNAVSANTTTPINFIPTNLPGNVSTGRYTINFQDTNLLPVVVPTVTELE